MIEFAERDRSVMIRTKLISGDQARDRHASFRIGSFRTMRTILLSVFAALLLGVSSMPRLAAADLPTPAGLNPGDTFRFIFQTSGTTTSESSDIADYNSFVNAQAAGATYSGSAITWYAMGSTPAVDARDNVGGFETDVPVYLVTGALVANDMSTATNGLWSGGVLTAVRYDINSNFIAEGRVWTGSEDNGTLYVGNGLGNGSTRFGVNSFTDAIWFSVSHTVNVSSYSMYAISAPLTVVPEPSTYVLGAIGAAMAMGCSGLRRRRSAANA